MRSASSALCLLTGVLLQLGAGGLVQADAETIATIRELVVAHHFKQPEPATFNPHSLDQVNTALQALDPYSTRLEPLTESSSAGTADQEPDFGIDLLPVQGRIQVIPRKNGSLYRAGFSDQHDLVTVDGVYVADLSLDEIGNLLLHAADAGTVSLGIRKHAQAGIQFVRISPAVSSRLPVEVIASNGQPYIRIHEFVTHETRRLLAESIRSLSPSSDTLVLDLRYASGGDLFEGLDSASLFLPGKKRLVTLVDGKGRAEDYYSLDDQRLVWKKVMILIGPSTASASEVFSQALQYYAAAFLAGARTHGKCLSQRIFSLPDGSRLRLSNRKILSPGGVYCAGKGLLPDISVAQQVLGDTRELIRRGQAYLVTE